MGQREIRQWSGRSVDAWRARWDVPALRVFASVGSTNDIARAMARDGAPEGTLILAEQQTAGRGRRGRSWLAPPGASLSMSMIFRPGEGESTRVLTLRLGLAAARAIEAVLPLRIELKWPNDLGVGGLKVGGILCEGDVMDDRIVHVVAGMGLNLHQRRDDWPPELADLATSLAAALDEAGEDPSTLEPGPLTGRIVREWLAVARRPEGHLTEAELAEFAARDALRGRPVAVDDEPAGTVEGIAPDGALRLRDDGRTRDVIAGTLRPL